MARDGMIQVRVDTRLKQQAEDLFNDLGLDTASAIRLFLKQAVMYPGAVAVKRASTRQVCSRPDSLSEDGLCDMAGNVWEMVADDYTPSYMNLPADGAVSPAESGIQVIRGGCWRSNADEVRTTYRGQMGKGYRDGDVGFRIVRTRAPVAE